MSAPEILEQLKKLAPAARLEIAEGLLHQVRFELSNMGEPQSDREEIDLARAARELLPDYSTNKELTAFSSLDSEPFHA